MYSMFKKAPSKNKLQVIIRNATQMVSNICPKNQHSEIDKYVESIYRESTHALIDKATIDHNFEHIIEIIYSLSTQRCSKETKDKLLELIGAFDIKIRTAYQITNELGTSK
jgi:hypothetical protein